jgi:hypothetical protein
VPGLRPDWPYGNLNAITFAEAAVAFEELTLGRKVDKLAVQTPDAWPNTFRQSRFISAVDMVQADRMRRRVALEMERRLLQVDLLLVPRDAGRLHRDFGPLSATPTTGRSASTPVVASVGVGAPERQDVEQNGGFCRPGCRPVILASPFDRLASAQPPHARIQGKWSDRIDPKRAVAPPQSRRSSLLSRTSPSESARVRPTAPSSHE